MKRRKARIVVWVITVWAILMGCTVMDLFVCPWTAPFHQMQVQKGR